MTMEDQAATTHADAEIVEALENSRFKRKTVGELKSEVTCCPDVSAHICSMKARGLVLFLDPSPDDGTEVVPCHATKL